MTARFASRWFTNRYRANQYRLGSMPAAILERLSRTLAGFDQASPYLCLAFGAWMRVLPFIALTIRAHLECGP